MRYLKYIFLFFIIFFIGCDFDSESVPVKNFSYDIVVIDSCEYIRSYTVYGHYVASHKGNCKNPIHYIQLYSGKTEGVLVYKHVKVPKGIVIDSARIVFK